MKTARIFLTALAGCIVFTSHQIAAQTSIQLFGPVNVRASASSTSSQSPADFNSNTLNLTCGASPSAVLSSTADSSGFVLVDNLINVSVTNGGVTAGPVNVCTGGVNGPPQNCFSTPYEDAAGNGGIDGTDPDTLNLQADGVPPINIGSLLAKNASQQVKIDLEDLGVVLTSTTLYLNTNCTVTGVSAPATVTGNPIPASNPTPQQLAQNFSFNTLSDNNITFQYDLTTAESAGTLTTTNGTIPTVGDSVVDPAQFQPVWATGTSFATSECLVHTGELLPSGASGCKLYTLTCTVGTGTDASGLNCPQSVDPNEVVRDVFDGPGFTLPDITTTVGGNQVTFHQGMGFLMASEPWNGGACQFATGSGFETETCPQNLLSTFSGPGLFTNSGITTHPNSTFISIAQVPEDLTTVTVEGTNSNGWVKTSTPTLSFSSQPPDLSNSGLPNAAGFVPSPITSITYGITPASSTQPQPGAPVAGDATLTNSTACPTPSNPSNPPAAVFTGQATLSSLTDGQYAVHYFAKDCAGTEELKYLQDGSGSWSTNFYTVPLNIDTVAPAVAPPGPTLSPAGPYTPGQTGVMATFSCTDATSGVVSCGGKTFTPGTTNTGSITVPVTIPTTPGMGTYTVTAIDAAGNQSSQSVNYTVNPPPFDSQIQLTLASGTVTYPLGTNLVVTVAKINSHTPTGTVLIQDGGVTVTKLTLGGGGAAYYYIQGLAAGTHTLTAVYSGDANNPGGTSAPVTLKVLPVPVTLAVSCWNTPYPYGANFQCVINASSNAGAPKGIITYTYDNNAPVSVTLNSGNANIVIPKPPVGNHSISISYPAQTNYAAAGPKVQNFVVQAAPVVVGLTPSSWYLTGGTLTLTASIQSWSAGPPNANGQVTFTNGSTVLGVMPVNATGGASVSVPASSLANGSQQITATYSGGVNYATGSTTITITVAH